MFFNLNLDTGNQEHPAEYHSRCKQEKGKKEKERKETIERKSGKRQKQTQMITSCFSSQSSESDGIPRSGVVYFKRQNESA